METRGVLRLVLLAELFILWPQLASAHANPAYYVIGQQKCGTSSLWSFMKTHPQLEAGSFGGQTKEQRFFQKLHAHSYGVMADRCDRQPMSYFALWPDLKEGELAGDFSPSHLSCYCCPELFQKLRPDARIIALLREPVSRSQSRFIEQYNWPFPKKGIITEIVRKYRNFGDYSVKEVSNLETCIRKLVRMPGGGNGTAIQSIQEFRCLASSNIIGWSAYSVYLKRWMEFFPPEQILVIYSNELEKDPLATLRKIEAHLGISEHNYSAALLQSKFNTHEKYGWRVGVLDVPAGDDEGAESTKLIFSTKEVDQDAKKIKDFAKKYKEPKKSSEQLKGNPRVALAFLKPYMQELQRMADAGIIRQPPKEFMQDYR